MQSHAALNMYVKYSELSSALTCTALAVSVGQDSISPSSAGVESFLPGPGLSVSDPGFMQTFQELRCVPVKACVHTSRRFSPCLGLHYGNQIYVSTSSGNLNVVSSWLLALSCGITYPEQLRFSWLN